MKDKVPRNVQLVSCDLNGTLVHQHTMMDMIRVYFPCEPERYEKAKTAFVRQTSGLLSIKEAFETAGSLTKGLSLRSAIEYVHDEVRFVEGFEKFITSLHEHGIHFVINSTGYSVTTETIKALYGREKIQGVICNRLRFGWEGDPHGSIDEDTLSELVRDYFCGKRGESLYDEIHAIGEVELGISDEADKPKMLFAIAGKLKVPRTGIAHIGDTMGDSEAIAEVARNGGLGIAFNYNEALKGYLESIVSNEELPGEIILAEPKNETPRLEGLLKLLVPR